MQKRPRTTRTLNPLPFEDLDPHRFEDLVRRLLYSFRDWTNIEPTGRGGSDDGFDVRAWERADTITNMDDDGEEGEHSLDGKLWQVQGKREKQLTPAKIKQIVRHDVDTANRPYGYILAAATNISKKSYDVFRQELRNKGVREFFFWGKDYLEDQLALPQNDEVLFTFFGISLSPRRRSRIAEIKFGLNNKNKILKLLFGNESMLGQNGQVPRGRSVLLRDIKDQHYPFKREYADFDTKRRWEEHDAVHVDPAGVYFKSREWYAYLDEQKKEWDFTKVVDLTPRRHNLDRLNEIRNEPEGRKVERYWRHLPQKNQAKFVVFGFVPFAEMLIIDEKGDPQYAAPHIFLDFGENGPFSYITGNLTSRPHHEAIPADVLDRTYKRIKVFATKFQEAETGRRHEPAELQIVGENLWTLTHLRRPGKLFGFDGRLDPIMEGDFISIPRGQGQTIDYSAEVTHKMTTTPAEFKKLFGEWEAARLHEYAGREISGEEEFTICEIIRVFRVEEHFIYSDDEY